MLTSIRIKNFKRFEEIEVPLGNGFVFIGSNNSGKTSVLQALALWHLGAQRTWADPNRRYALSINRRDLVHVPTRFLALLWHNRVLRKGPENIPIEITVFGLANGRTWEHGVQFIYSSSEVLYCKALTNESETNDYQQPKIAMLPSMSGLAQVEPKIEPGRIDVLLGEGQTAQVLRNTCYNLMESNRDKWEKLRTNIENMFGIEMLDPTHDIGRGEIYMEYYREGTGRKNTSRRKGDILDLQSAGRGLQQTILLLAFIYGNAADVLLLDEPDAHLEILRQRRIYKTIQREAENEGRQILVASHSEVLLKEADELKKAVSFSFVGRPPYAILSHQQFTYARKALAEIDYVDYQNAERCGWVLYAEDTSDFDILIAFAQHLEHPVALYLESSYAEYIKTNAPQEARNHFYPLRDAIPDLTGVLIVDRIDKQLHHDTPLVEMMWKKREIENYICSRHALMEVVADDKNNDIFGVLDASSRREMMAEEIEELEQAQKKLRKPSPFSSEIKASDKFLVPLFANYSERLGVKQYLKKSDFYQIVQFIPKEEIDPEITEKLDSIYKVATEAEARIIA